MKRKSLTTFAAALLTATIALSGCSSGTSDTDPSGDVTITVFDAYASEDPHGQYVYQYADAFMAEHPNIKVEITAINSNDIFTKIAAMSTDPESLPTLFFTSVDQAPSLYDLGLTEDLNDYVDQDTLDSFAPGVIESTTLDDTMAFYPIALQPLAILYRIDRFEEAGISVPANWEEFVSAAEQLTEDTNGDGEADEWGFSMVGSNNSSGQSRFMSYLWSNGIQVVSQDSSGKWVTDVDSPEFAAAFTTWTDMNNREGIVPTGITSIDYPTAANYFAMGYTNTMISGGNALGVAYAANPDLKGKIGTFPIPGTEPGTMLNTEGFALSASASEDEKKAAIEYLTYFNTNDSDLMFWQSSGKIPATTEGEQAEYLKGDDYKGYLDTIQAGCRPVLNFGGLAAVKTALGDAYSSVFSGELTNEQAIKKLQADIDQVLQDYN